MGFIMKKIIHSLLAAYLFTFAATSHAMETPKPVASGPEEHMTEGIQHLSLVDPHNNHPGRRNRRPDTPFILRSRELTGRITRKQKTHFLMFSLLVYLIKISFKLLMTFLYRCKEVKKYEEKYIRE